MAVKDEIQWFKDQFTADILPALAGTPLSFDLICALAFQETGELWSKLRLKVSRDDVLRLCVGDTLDAPNRSAFPKNRDELIGVDKGSQMFALAHQLLVEMGDATEIEAYQNLGARPEKFVHGYGIFQYDLQYFKRDPGFFLEQKWKNIRNCVDKLMTELKGALTDLGYDGFTSLTDQQSAFVAIVYNSGFGHFDESRGLQQGYFDGRHYYGENIDRFLQIAKSIPTKGAVQPPSQLQLADPAVVRVAKTEYDAYHGVREGDQPLRGRIADYYEAGGGSRSLDPTLNRNAWSAAFVSFCVKQSGASFSQFKFDLSHSVFVNAAIANADANVGVFRGRPVEDYAPKLGDIIHHNREGSGNDFDYDYARRHVGYESHSAIVVDFQMRGGVRNAVTIGGNEANSIGEKFFPLLSDGRLNEQAIAVKLICVIENQLAAATAGGSLGRFVVNVRTDLKLRGGPGTEFEVLKVLHNGDILEVLGYDDEPSGRWALVDLEGDGRKDGFVFASFLDRLTS